MKIKNKIYRVPSIKEDPIKVEYQYKGNLVSGTFSTYDEVVDFLKQSPNPSHRIPWIKVKALVTQKRVGNVGIIPVRDLKIWRD